MRVVKTLKTHHIFTIRTSDKGLFCIVFTLWVPQVFVATIKQKYPLRKRRWKKRGKNKDKSIWHLRGSNREPLASTSNLLPTSLLYSSVAVRNRENMRVVKTLKISVPRAYGTKFRNTAKLFYPKLPFLQVWTKSEGGRSWPPLVSR